MHLTQSFGESTNCACRWDFQRRSSPVFPGLTCGRSRLLDDADPEPSLVEKWFALSVTLPFDPIPKGRRLGALHCRSFRCYSTYMSPFALKLGITAAEYKQFVRAATLKTSGDCKSDVQFDKQRRWSLLTWSEMTLTQRSRLTRRANMVTKKNQPWHKQNREIRNRSDQS